MMKFATTSRRCTTSTHPICFIELLEERRALSGGAVAASDLSTGQNADWPAAPFSRDQYRGTIYVNQRGDAIVRKQALDAQHPFNG